MSPKTRLSEEDIQLIEEHARSGKERLRQPASTGTFHDGDPGWNRRTYEWLYDHGWAWPQQNPPAGEPPSHNPW